MSQRRSETGSNKRVMVMLVLIVVLGGIYAALNFAPDALRNLTGGAATTDLTMWEPEPVVEPSPALVETGSGLEELEATALYADPESAEVDGTEHGATASTGDSARREPPVRVAAADAADLSLDYSALDPATREFLELRRRLDVAQARLQVQQTTAAIEEASRQVEGVRLGTNAIPMLVGVTGSPGRGLRAEFHLGGSQRVALSPGGWITPHWKLVAVDVAGAEVENSKGERSRLVLGTRPVQPQSMMPGAVL